MDTNHTHRTTERSAASRWFRAGVISMTIMVALMLCASGFSDGLSSGALTFAMLGMLAGVIGVACVFVAGCCAIVSALQKR